MLIKFTDLKIKYKMSIDGVIHVGAHYGEEIQEYISNGIQNIVLFEPIEKNFDILFDKLKNVNANIQAYQVALGSEEKVSEMFLSSNNAESSSLLKPKQHLELHPNVLFEGIEQVEIKTLDSYNLSGYNFMNIDVQGYELEVFKGSKETLNNIDYVYCEVNRDEVYENNAFIEEIDEFLNPYNFTRVETYWPETWYTWGDALYIKQR